MVGLCLGLDRLVVLGHHILLISNFSRQIQAQGGHFARRKVAQCIRGERQLPEEIGQELAVWAGFTANVYVQVCLQVRQQQIKAQRG